MDDKLRAAIEHAVGVALAEDVGQGDLTTQTTVPVKAQARAVIVAREPLVLAGTAVAEAVFRRTAPEAELDIRATDGVLLTRGNEVLEVSGPARGILTGERVALNFLQRLSGVATLTRKFVESVEGTGTVILDTRKTTPGLRTLEKYAVVCGGGRNHRLGLFDLVLIKDNHLATLMTEAAHPIRLAIQRARQRCPGQPIEVEVDNLTQLAEAIEVGVDRVLLDNMSIEQLRTAVALARGKVITEASGGVSLETVRAIAETGVDFISVGALTHSARSVDLALDFRTP
jgi:nicotinate-nucleotide pyrophosphorylase (carboxylating)